MKRALQKFTAAAAALAVVLTAAVLPASAAPEAPDALPVDALAAPADAGANDYAAYLAAQSGVNPGAAAIDLAASAAVGADGAALQPQGEAVRWTGGALRWNFTVPADGVFEFLLTYAPAEAGVNYEYGLLLDGAAPFADAASVTFPRLWENATDEVRTDAAGNELSPEQREVADPVTVAAADETGVAVGRYRFLLRAGAHTFDLVSDGQPVLLYGAQFAPAEQPAAYTAPTDAAPAVTDPVRVEGEAAFRKTSSALIPKADNGSAGMSPASPGIQRLNYIGGTTWQSPGATLSWQVEIPAAGWYAFGARYRQSDVVNAESWRTLRVDGEIPFAEAAGIRFPYAPTWRFFTFEDAQGEPYRIWLEPGAHTISLEVTLGDMAEYYGRLSALVDRRGDAYIDMVKITGATPDISLDYELFNQIPDLGPTLADCCNQLVALAHDLEDFSGARGSQYIAAVENMARVLRKMVQSPYVAHHYVNDYYSNYTSLSSWLYDMKAMPLSLDYFELAPVGASFRKGSPGLLRRVSFLLRRLLISFTEDYAATEEGEEGLRLWVNWGRDQASVLDALIRDSFTPATGIPVRLEITNASLVNGLLAGNFPDMSLQMARTEPVNLGMRGALYDLTQFDDLEQVLSRFQPGAETPYRLGDELYALPDTQSFFLQFYRSDILGSLGLSVPKTWDEFLYAAAIIQRNNMDVYVPYTQITASTTVSVGVGSLNLFPTLMGQNGLSLYNKEQTATALVSPEAIHVFEFWTRLYNDYGFQKEADFYNRFRIGVMPLGIAPYSTYMTLYSAAPEIEGRWSIAPVPGTAGGNNSVAGAGTGCVILKKSPHIDKAWEFLKWWTSAETQTRFSSNIESLLGMLGRPQTATVDAFRALRWDRGDLDVLLEQWSRVREVPEVPGSYYLSRALDQAYWSVLNDNVGVRDAVVKWSGVADAEIDRKIREYR